MLVVKVELHSAVTGQVTEIARAHIANTGKYIGVDKTTKTRIYEYAASCFEFMGKFSGSKGGRSTQTQFKEPVLQFVARVILDTYKDDKV